jgi:hypothetical protein
MARAGQRDTFKEGRDDLREFSEIYVTAKDVERVAEGVGEAEITLERAGYICPNCGARQARLA